MEERSSGTMAPADAPGSGQRARHRDSLFLMARLKLPDERAARDVRVRNLSEDGLMIELDRPLAGGAALTMTLRGVGEVTGRVAWCAEGRIGVAFDRPIEPKLARKPVGGGATTPDYVRPIIIRDRAADDGPPPAKE